MSELVKGITIPDEAYLHYASGEGPQRMHKNFEYEGIISAQTEVAFNGMRLDDIAKAVIIHGGESAEDIAPVVSPDGGKVTCTWDLTAFTKGLSPTTFWDTDGKEVKSDVVVELKDAP